MKTKVFVVKVEGMTATLLDKRTFVTLEKDDIVVVVTAQGQEYVTHHQIGCEPNEIDLTLGAIQASKDLFAYHEEKVTNS